MAKKEVDMKNYTNVVGKTAFLVGFILAIIAGAFNIIDGMWTMVLALIGLLVGLLNVTEKETQPFLMSGTVLILVSALGQGIFLTMPIVDRVLIALLVIFIPATIIVAIRNVYNIAKD